METIYSIIVPVFNEEESLASFCERIHAVMDPLGETFEIVFVDDGSSDGSEALIRKLSASDESIRLVSLSRNFGQQAAITAGLEAASGQASIIIDADLQDPPEIIPKMIEKWKSGCDVAYGRRTTRKRETLAKKATAAIFYRIMRRITDSDLPVDAGDFRLLDRKVRDAMLRFPERNRYVRGLVSWTGFRQVPVDYSREERHAGRTKYSFRKMLRFALDAVASFSNKPLKVSSYLGIFFSLGSFLYLAVVVFQRLFTETTIVGWSSIVAINLFFNGIVLIMLGVIGEYVGRIYDESKGRPLYIVKDRAGFPGE